MFFHIKVNKEDTNLNIPSINIIPNTPLFFEKNDCDMVRNYNLNCNFVKMAVYKIFLFQFYFDSINSIDKIFIDILLSNLSLIIIIIID